MYKTKGQVTETSRFIKSVLDKNDIRYSFKRTRSSHSVYIKILGEKEVIIRVSDHTQRYNTHRKNVIDVLVDKPTSLRKVFTTLETLKSINAC